MKDAGLFISITAVPLIFFAGCSSSPHLKVVHQTIGFIQTNCYLLFDTGSGEAAVIDAAGPLDSLESTIDKNHIKLKYIFITHCHPDHVYGLLSLKEKYPSAAICISKQDYEDAGMYTRWESALRPEEVAAIKENPDAVSLMNFNYSLKGKPDIYVEDNQIFKLGKNEIRAILSPGHSRGSICYYAGNMLFSGDVLFYRSVGRTDAPGMSWEKIVESVRRLYAELPDSTVVYPGHEQLTDIGSEKKFNSRVTAESINKP